MIMLLHGEDEGRGGSTVKIHTISIITVTK